MPVVVGKYVCHIRGLSFSRAVWFSWTIRIRRPGTNQMFYESSYPSETKKIGLRPRSEESSQRLWRTLT